MDPTKRQIPSPARRGVFVLCHAFVPYLLDKLLVCLENELEGGQESRRRQQVGSVPWSLESWLRRWVQKAAALCSEPQRRACLNAVFVLQQSLTLLYRLHSALFYVSGSFHHLSKRVADISYVGNFKKIQCCGKYLSPISFFLLIFAYLSYLNVSDHLWYHCG